MFSSGFDKSPDLLCAFSFYLPAPGIMGENLNCIASKLPCPIETQMKPACYRGMHAYPAFYIHVLIILHRNKKSPGLSSPGLRSNTDCLHRFLKTPRQAAAGNLNAMNFFIYISAHLTCSKLQEIHSLTI